LDEVEDLAFVLGDAFAPRALFSFDPCAPDVPRDEVRAFVVFEPFFEALAARREGDRLLVFALALEVRAFDLVFFPEEAVERFLELVDIAIFYKPPEPS
jgi:hypothetical protein